MAATLKIENTKILLSTTKSFIVKLKQESSISFLAVVNCVFLYSYGQYLGILLILEVVVVVVYCLKYKVHH